jgi:hypothetical protein
MSTSNNGQTMSAPNVTSPIAVGNNITSNNNTTEAAAAPVTKNANQTSVSNNDGPPGVKSLNDVFRYSLYNSAFLHECKSAKYTYNDFRQDGTHLRIQTLQLVKKFEHILAHKRS